MERVIDRWPEPAVELSTGNNQKQLIKSWDEIPSEVALTAHLIGVSFQN